MATKCTWVAKKALNSRAELVQYQHHTHESLTKTSVFQSELIRLASLQKATCATKRQMVSGTQPLLSRVLMFSVVMHRDQGRKKNKRGQRAQPLSLTRLGKLNPCASIHHQHRGEAEKG